MYHFLCLYYSLKGILIWLDHLYEAMKPIDKETRLPRGYLLLTKGQQNPLSLLKLKTQGSWARLDELITNTLPSSLQKADSLPQAISLLLSPFCHQHDFIIHMGLPGVDLAGKGLTKEHILEINTLLDQVSNHDLFDIVSDTVLKSPDLKHIFFVDKEWSLNAPSQMLRRVLATVILLSLPEKALTGLAPALVTRLQSLRKIPFDFYLLKKEVDRIKEQFEVLLNHHCRCGKKH